MHLGGAGSHQRIEGVAQPLGERCFDGPVDVGRRQLLKVCVLAVVAQRQQLAGREVSQPSVRSQDRSVLGGAPVVVGSSGVQRGAVGQAERAGQRQGDEVRVEVERLALGLAGAEAMGESGSAKMVQNRGDPVP